MARLGKPRQTDIARRTGLSQATVSLVLTGRAAEHAIPEATQKRVLDAITELGYVPNVAARSLRGGRNGLIGVHTFERVFPVTSEDYYHEFLIGIEEQAAAMTLDLVLFASMQRAGGSGRIYGDGSNRLRLADGAVLLGIERDDAELERLAAEGFPFVFIGRRDGVESRMPYVTADYAGALSDVLELLHSMSHRSIAYLGRVERTTPQEDRLEGFLQHSRRLGLGTSPPRFVAPTEVSADWLRSARAAGVTAVIVESFELAAALTDVAGAAGVAIPDRLSMVCLDVGPRGSARQGWSQIEVPRRELGRRSVALLMELLDGNITTDYHEVLACRPPSLATIAGPTQVDSVAGRRSNAVPD